MVATIIANTVSWVSTVQQPFNDLIVKYFPDASRDVNWLAIISAVIFLGFVVWTIWDLCRQLEKYESGRPELICGKRMGVKITSIPNSYQSDITLKLLFSNIGKKKAYQFRQKVGFAPSYNVAKFKKIDDLTSVNPICPDEFSDHGREITFRQTIGADPTSWLIYTGIDYSDSEIKGNWYKDEFWFCYHVGNENLSNATAKQKIELEPYVRKVYSNSTQEGEVKDGK